MREYVYDSGVYIVDQQLRPIYLIDNYKSLVWTERYNEAGDFELEMPISSASKILELLKYNSFLQLEAAESFQTMIVEGIEITTDPDEGDSIVYSGRSAESLLDRRVAWKNHTLEDFDVDIVVRKLIKENVATPELMERRFISSEDGHNMVQWIDPYDPNDTIAKTSVSVTYTGDNIYEAVSDLCKEYGFGFKMTTGTSTYKITTVNRSEYNHVLKTASTTTFNKLLGNYNYSYATTSSCTETTYRLTAAATLKNGPSSKATTVTTLASGTDFQVAGVSGTWLYIKYGTGFANTGYISDNSSTYNTSATTNGAYLYQSYSTTASKVVLVPRSTSLTWLATKINGSTIWYKVTYGSYTGYILGTKVTVTSSRSNNLTIEQDPDDDGTYNNKFTKSDLASKNYYMYSYYHDSSYYYGDIRCGTTTFKKCRVSVDNWSSTTTTYSMVPIFADRNTFSADSKIIAWVDGGLELTNVKDAASTYTFTSYNGFYTKQGDPSRPISIALGGSYDQAAWDKAVSQGLVSSSAKNDKLDGSTINGDKGWYIYILNKLGLVANQYSGGGGTITQQYSGTVSGYLYSSHGVTSNTANTDVPMLKTASSSAETEITIPSGQRVAVLKDVVDSSTETKYSYCAWTRKESGNMTESVMYYGYIKKSYITESTDTDACSIFQFQLYDGIDRSVGVVFSQDYDSIDNITYVEDYEDYYNVCMVQGETDKKQVWAETENKTADSDIMFFNRRETYKDETSTDNTKYDSDGEPVAATDEDGNTIWQTKSSSIAMYDAASSGSKIDLGTVAEGTSVTYSGTVDSWQTAKDNSEKIYVTINGTSGYVSASSIETVDATLTDEEYETLLIGKGKSELGDSKWPVSMDGELQGETYVYGTDFKMGDIVGVDNGYNHSGTARVTEMIFSFEAGEYKVYPTFEFVNKESAFEYDEESTNSTKTSHYYDAAWRLAKRQELIEDSKATDKLDKAWFIYILYLLGKINNNTASTVSSGRYYSTAWNNAVNQGIVGSSTPEETFNKGWYIYILNELDEID